MGDANKTYDPNEVVTACPTCKSVQVLDQMWVDCNTDLIHSTCDRYRWCCACEQDGNDGEHGTLIEIRRCESREWLEKHAASTTAEN